MDILINKGPIRLQIQRYVKNDQKLTSKPNFFCFYSNIKIPKFGLMIQT